jgi:hypothetical protein
MTGPTKPRKPRASKLAAVPPTTGTMSPLEHRVVNALRRMDERSQSNIEAIANQFCRDFPRRATSPLRLVVGGAS